MAGIQPRQEETDEELKQDWELLDRYQAFSAELLRIALLGIAGVGLLVTDLPEKNSVLNAAVREPATVGRLCAALVALGISAAAALAHRYISSDSMAFYVKLMRMRRRGAPEGSVNSVAQNRNLRFKWSGRLLLLSAVSLALGAGALAMAFTGMLARAA